MTSLPLNCLFILCNALGFPSKCNDESCTHCPIQVALSASLSQLIPLSAETEFSILSSGSLELGAVSSAFIQMPRTYLSAAVSQSLLINFDRTVNEVIEEFKRTCLDDVVPRDCLPKQPSIPKLGTEAADRVFIESFVEFLYPSEGTSLSPQRSPSSPYQIICGHLNYLAYIWDNAMSAWCHDCESCRGKQSLSCCIVCDACVTLISSHSGAR